MQNKWLVRGLLIGLAVILGVLLWWLMTQPLPNVFVVGIVAALLGCTLAVLVTRRSK